MCRGFVAAARGKGFCEAHSKSRLPAGAGPCDRDEFDREQSEREKRPEREGFPEPEGISEQIRKGRVKQRARLGVCVGVWCR